MVPWWGMKPWQANTRHQSKLLFWKRCRGRSPDRYLAQAWKTKAWRLPRACAPWSLSFPWEGPVSAMLAGFGCLGPHTEHHLSAAGRQLSVPLKTGRLSHHLRQAARCAPHLQEHCYSSLEQRSQSWVVSSLGWAQGQHLGKLSSNQVKSSGETTAMKRCWLTKGNMDGIGYPLGQLIQLTLEMDASTPVLCQAKDFLG